jgi:N-acetylneuraminic acid mutarotase
MEWDVKAKEIHFSELPSLPEPVSNAAITLTGNTVYLAGGENSRQTTAQFLSLNLSNIKAGWIKLADIPHPVSHTVLTAVTGTTGNRIYLSGGRKKNNNGISDLFSEVFAYDIAANTWDQKKSLPYPLSAGTGLFHNSNSFLLFGGDKGTVFHQAETLIAAINTEKDTMKKNGMIREKINLQSSHPGFSREVLRYDLNNDTWMAAGTIPYETPVTTTAVETSKGIIIPSGEIRAGVRSPKILKLLIRRKKK